MDRKARILSESDHYAYKSYMLMRRELYGVIANQSDADMNMLYRLEAESLSARKRGRKRRK